MVSVPIADVVIGVGFASDVAKRILLLVDKRDMFLLPENSELSIVLWANVSFCALEVLLEML